MEGREISEDNVGEIIAGIGIDEIEGKKEKIYEEESQKAVKKEKKTYEEFIKQLDLLCARFPIPHSLYERVFDQDRMIEIDIPILLEQKSRGKDIIRIFTGYWAEHSDLLGPYFGEINFLPGIKADEVKGLAALSTLKNALLDLPFGGAAGGAAVNPILFNNKERERLARSYIKGMLRFLDFDKDILSSGSGLDEKSVSFMYHECKKLEDGALKEARKGKERKGREGEIEEQKKEKVGKNEIGKKKDFKGNFLGKSFQDSGLRARNQAIASSISLMLDELLKRQEITKLPGIEKHEDIIKKSPREITVAFHGFNQVEQELAFMLFNAGYKIIAISDSFGAIASSGGIDPHDAARWQKNHRSVAGLPKIPRVRKEQLHEIRSEMLILGSGSDSIIDEELARKIKANMVIELEDLLTNDATTSLRDAEKIVLPYIVTSCSIRLVNYLEWLQNQENKFFTQKEIDKKIEDKIKILFGRINKTSATHGLDLKDAAFLTAIEKISEKLS